MENKNQQILKNFVDYCNKNPDMSFWYALRKWSKYVFIYGSTRQINTKKKNWMENIVLAERDGSKLSP